MALPNLHLYVLLLLFTNSLSLATFRIFYTDPDGTVLGFGNQKGFLNTLWLALSAIVVIFSLAGLGVSSWRVRYRYKLAGVGKYQFPPPQLPNQSLASMATTCGNTCPHRNLTPSCSSSITYVNGFGPTKPSSPAGSALPERHSPTFKSQGGPIPLISPNSGGKYILGGIAPSSQGANSQPTTPSSHSPNPNAQGAVRGSIPLITPGSDGKYTLNSAAASNPQDTSSGPWPKASSSCRLKPTAIHIPESRHYYRGSSEKALPPPANGYESPKVPFYMSASDVCPLRESKWPEQARAKTSPRLQSDIGGSCEGERRKDSRNEQQRNSDTLEFRQACIYDADGKKITLYGV